MHTTEHRRIEIAPEHAPLVSDHELHHWGEMYQANPRIGQAGVRFETFLRDPHGVLAALLWPEIIDQTQRLQAALDDCTEQARACCAEVCAYVVAVVDARHEARDLVRGDSRVQRLLRAVERLPELHGCNGALVQPIHCPSANRRPGRKHLPQTLEASR